MKGLFAIVLAAVVGFVPAAAATDSWVPVGPPGGDVRALAADPNRPGRIYLGTADGVLYRSDDAGHRWQRMAPGFPRRGCSLDEIAVDGHGTVYVGFWEVDGKGGGVASSDDGGRTFTLLRGIAGESVRALAVSATTPAWIAAGSRNGTFLSRDGGRSWSRITPAGHPDLRNFESLAFDPGDPNALYVGTWHLGWRTEDGGRSWRPMHDGMIDDSDVMTLTVDRDTHGLYATACTGIYRCDSIGARWRKLEGIPHSSRRTRAFALAGGGDVLLAGTTEGLWISDDRGTRWRRATDTTVVVNAIVVQPDGAILLGVEDDGVLRSEDGGRTWAASNDGFSERFVTTQLFDFDSRQFLVAVRAAHRGAGVYAADDSRGPWTHAGRGLEGRQVLSLAAVGGTVLAGTDDGVFALGGSTPVWTRLPTRVAGREVHPRVVDLAVRGADVILAATSSGILYSADRGRSWGRSAEGQEVSSLALCPSKPNQVIAAVRGGFLRSGDGGATWVPAWSAPEGITPHAVSFLPPGERVLLATTTGGLYRSSDGGLTWSRAGGGIPHSDLTGLAVGEDGRTVWVSDFGHGGVFRSDDGGETWSRVTTDGLASDRVWTLSLDPTSPERVLAGSAAGGLHLRTAADRRSSSASSIDAAASP